MSITENTSDKRGNIVFFQSYGTDIWSQITTNIVQTCNHGPYVHCEIIYGKNDAGLLAGVSKDEWITIGAHGNGIKFGVLPPRSIIASIQGLNTGNNGKVLPLDQGQLLYALDWTKMHLNVPYGAIDNLDQVIDFVFPWNKLHLTERDHFNCSNFVCAFFVEAGIHLPLNFTFPFNVSPNDLAEWMGLLPKRKRILP